MIVANNYDDYVSNKLTYGEPTNEPRCPICVEDWSEEEGDNVITHCGHGFHKECLLTWAVFWMVPGEVSDWDLPPLEEQVEFDAYNDIENVLGDELDEDDVLELTGINLKDTRNADRFVQASRKLYDVLIAATSSIQPKFLILIRKGLITRRLLARYDGEMNPREWLSLVQELKAYQDEVRSLGTPQDAPEQYPDGMLLPGIDSWSAIIQPHLYTIYDVQSDILLGTLVATKYRLSNQGANVVIDQTHFDHRPGQQTVVNFHDEITISTKRRLSHTVSRLRIALNNLSAISDMSISADLNNIDIFTTNGHLVNLRLLPFENASRPQLSQ
ncbi:hypothetical protein N0V90_007771 [Kalmusia sp. IMI 367209]|nr:hypothetical protein N0V90_007771 [Kalmusia sp. IMI 367209]